MLRFSEGLFDLLTATDDPYPLYESLRELNPVSYIEPDDLWVVSRYDDVVHVLRHPEEFSSALGMGRLFAGKIGPSAFEGEEGSLLGMSIEDLRILIASDPPIHTRLRRMVSQAFTPRVVAEFEGRARQICGELVDRALADQAPDTGTDLITALAWPFPVMVIAELLGVPPERRADFKRWSDALVGGLAGTLAIGEVQGSAGELFAFLGEWIEHRRLHPGEDLISRLVAVGGQGAESLLPEEIMMFCVLLLVAGNETTTNLIGNAAAALFANPDQACRLKADRSLVPAAIEETLRFDPPVQALFRGTTRSLEVAGVGIPDGATVMVLVASANRDPAHFSGAERFDIGRNPRDHVGFGSGIHLCIGAPLARLEARIAAETLLEKVATVEPAGDPVRQPGYLLRGFSSLPVTAA